MPFSRTRAVLNVVPASPASRTPGMPTHSEIEAIRIAAAAHRSRMLGAILLDLLTLPADLLRDRVVRTDRQAA